MDVSNKVKKSKLLKKARERAKKDCCFICGKSCTSFCQSHSIPYFILKNISLNGENYTFYKLLKDNYLFEEEAGNKSAGNFYLICNECDNNFFKDYESEKLLLNGLNNKMMAEIALKNYLKSISKNRIEIELYKHIMANKGFKPSFQYYINLREMDLKEYLINYKKCISIIDKNLKSGFKVMYYKQLDYICPIAFQDTFSLYTDLKGKVINDLYNFDKDISMKYIHICVFPLSAKTIVIMFRHTEDACYKSFENQVKKLSDGEILKLISFIIVNYFEDFYISKSINDDILSNKYIRKVAETIPDIKASSRTEVEKMVLGKKNEINNYKNFVNLLSEEFKIM